MTFHSILVKLLAAAAATTLIYATSQYISTWPSVSLVTDRDTEQNAWLHPMDLSLKPEETAATQSDDTLRDDTMLNGDVTVTGNSTTSWPDYHSYRLRLNESERSKLKTIRFLDGWDNAPENVQGEGARRFPSNFLQSCDYRCKIENGTQDTTGAGMSVFSANGLTSFERPPKKSADDLWMFLSGESQYVNSKKPSQWDGLFNYSTTFLSESRVSGQIWGYARNLIKRSLVTSRNFAKERRAKNKVSVKVTALWFVSNCNDDRWVQPKSARVPYALELSQFINISAYTKTDLCLKPLAPIIKKVSLNNQPKMDDFLFYLSFENNVCRDYITEKLWKVLSMDTFTIPVVLGGKDISDYTKRAPPNSFIHVRNFTSPKHLADHLKYVASNDDAFNYYHQWRNEYEIESTDKDRMEAKLCYFCMLVHERPPGIWKTFSKDFTDKDCTNLLQPENYCKYYNMSCTVNTASSTVHVTTNILLVSLFFLLNFYLS